jgi:autotransporter-associated beta strand protein
LFTGAISGTGSFQQLGTGTTILTANNTYSGGTTISAGTLQLGNGGTTGSITGNVIDNGILAINRSDAVLFAGAISGTGAFQQLGAGTTILTANNTYGGGTTISAGTLQLGNGGTTGSITGNVIDNGILAINRSDAVLFTGTISGTGSFQQLGTSTTILTADNTYSGGTTISAGTLQLGNGGATGSIVGDVVDSGIFAINRSNGLTFNGVISGSGQVQQLGAGTTTLTALQSYSGLTTIGAGTLALTGAGNIASSSGVVANGAFDISGVGGAGTSIKTLSGSGSVALGGKTLTLTSASGNFAGAIGGTGGVTLAAGTETLSGNNTYTGITMVTAGTLQAGSNTAFSSSSAFVVGTTTTTATLDLNGFSNTIASLAGNANGIITNSAMNTSPVLTVGGDNNSTIFAGDIKDGLRSVGVSTRGVGLTKVGSGTLLLSGNNSYTRATTIQAGALRAGSTTAFSPSSAFTVGTGTTIATLDLNGFSNGIGPLSGNANGAVTNTSTTAAATLTTNAADVTGAVSTTFAGTVTDTSAAGATDATAAGKLSLVKNGGGTLTLSGSVSYKGDTTINAGTLVVTNAFTNVGGSKLTVNAASYTIGQLLTNAGAIIVNSGGTLNASVGGITNTATGSITVALGGTVNDDLNNAGVVTNSGGYVANIATNTGAGNITNTTTGNWTGNVLSNAAIISNSGLWTGNATNSAGGTLNNSGIWTGTIANAGTFNNNTGATVSGLLTNTAGTTVNNGALNGGATISGGTFTGSGTVTNLTVSGGTFAPGNGTPGSSMTVSGNLALQSGAMYLVTLNPTTSTFASVSGTAALNGTAAAVYLAGNYISKKYTVLTAAGGVAGTFGSLVNTNVPANFTSSLSYDANHAYIDLALNFVPNPAPNFGSGLNINQQNVANTLVNFFNTAGGIPLAFGTLTPAGLTQASGELGTGIIQTAIKADDMFLNLLLDPTVAGRAGGFASGPAASQFAADDEEALAYAAKRKASSAERAAYAMATKAPYLAPQPVNRWSVWGAAYGGSATTDGNAIVGSHATTTRAYGVVGGADYKVTPDTLIGFALAGGGTNYSLSDALGTGRSDLFQAGVFGRQNIGAAYLSAALASGWHDVTTNRTVALPGGDVLQARFRAETFSGRFEGGYRFATPFAGITPYVAAQAISFNLPAYAEQVLGGAGTFALNYGAQTTTATRTELGLRSDKSFAVQDGSFTLRGRAAWAHDYNNDRAVTAVFQALPGASFVVNGARANPDGALVSAGAEMKWLNGFSLAATFEGEFSGNTTSYAGKGVAKYSW